MDLLKTLLPDILTLYKHLNDPNSEKIRLLNNLLKIFSEDDELFKKLADS
jgi:hypothetical protein